VNHCGAELKIQINSIHDEGYYRNVLYLISTYIFFCHFLLCPNSMIRVTVENKFQCIFTIGILDLRLQLCSHFILKNSTSIWKRFLWNQTIKPTHEPCGHLYQAVTCIKKSPFSCPVIENFIIMNWTSIKRPPVL
jgi:hypothetical protein